LSQPPVVPVLVYHKCPDDFVEQLAYIKSLHLTLVHLSDITDYFVTQASSRYPHNKIVITFDDAYKDFKENALPLLEAATEDSYQCKATVCVPVGCITDGVQECSDLDPQELMNWEELKELAKHSNLQFLPHSVSHERFNLLDGRPDKKTRLEYEIGESKYKLITRLELKDAPLFFCLPGGAGWKTGQETNAHDRLIIDVLRKYDYIGALRAEYRSGEDWNQYCIPRCESACMQRLKELLEGDFSCKD